MLDIRLYSGLHLKGLSHLGQDMTNTSVMSDDDTYHPEDGSDTEEIEALYQPNQEDAIHLLEMQMESLRVNLLIESERLTRLERVVAKCCSLVDITRLVAAVAVLVSFYVGATNV